jgi:hypothetical protein
VGWRWLCSRWLVRVGIAVVVAVALAYAGSFAVDGWLRQRVEAGMNQRLTGYTARVGGLSLHPIGLSVTLRDVVMTQDAHPDPPVLSIPRLDASVQWRAIVFGRVVANFTLDRPVVHADLEHLRREARDPTPLDQHGWQQALEAVYPFRINELRIVEGSVTYLDAPKARPLTLTRLNAKAGNIRNVWSAARVYPSTIEATAVVFERGRLALDGHADFLAEPFPGVKSHVVLENVPLDAARPALAHYNLQVAAGTFGAEGELEYAPPVKTLALSRVDLTGARADYVHRPVTAGAEQARAETVKRTAEEANNAPGVLLKVDRVHATGTFGYVDETRTPGYRAFLSDVDFTVTNFSNHFEQGPAGVKLTGKFMGSGPTTAAGTFRPERHGPDFDLDVKVENTDMRTMNGLFRAYGNFDVVGGLFSFYSELRVQRGAVAGYVKPLFRDVKVYDERQDEEKSLFRKLYEKLVGGVAHLLENPPRKEVATKANVAGPVENPKASTLQVLGNLLRNAFIKAILPGFEEEVGRSSGQRPQR